MNKLAIASLIAMLATPASAETVSAIVLQSVPVYDEYIDCNNTVQSKIIGFDVYWTYQNFNGVEFTTKLYKPGEVIPQYVPDDQD